MRVSLISSKKNLEKAFAIRIRVFVAEQGVPQEIEMDRDDKRALQFLAIEAGKAVGTARVVMRQKGAKIGRMAVLKTRRGGALGRSY